MRVALGVVVAVAVALLCVAPAFTDALRLPAALHSTTALPLTLVICLARTRVLIRSFPAPLPSLSPPLLSFRVPRYQSCITR